MSIKNDETKYNDETSISLGSRFFSHFEQEKRQRKFKYQDNHEANDSETVYSLESLPDGISQIISHPCRDLNNSKENIKD
jgi:hypothetical protein